MAQTAERTVIRKNIRLAGGKQLIFDRSDGFWRVAFYRPRRRDDEGNEVTRELQRDMERAGMLPKMPAKFWTRIPFKHAQLEMAIAGALLNGGYPFIARDVIDYIQTCEWSWYLDA